MSIAVAFPDDGGAPSLQEAISQQITLGERDPLTIARRVANLYGGDWIAQQFSAHWEEILAEIARQRIGAERRVAVQSLSGKARERGGKVAKRELVLTTVFVPGKGYVAFGEATAEDLAAREAYMRKLADGLTRWADWYADVRAALIAQGVERVREIKGQLPQLPQPSAGELGA